jgi:hypothetical protein
MDLRVIECGEMDWIDLDQDRVYANGPSSSIKYL